jgi:hypothetical protein
MNEDSSELLLLDKANFILQSINLAAVVVTAQQLMMTIPVILVKAYEGLFEEKVAGINYSPSSKFDHACNCEIILRNLYDKFRLQVFQDITGSMIVDGHPQAVYPVVDFMFEIAKRIIQRKLHENIFEDVEKQTTTETELPHVSSPTKASDQALQEFYSLKKQLQCKDGINAVLKRIVGVRVSEHVDESVAAKPKTAPAQKKKKKNHKLQTDSAVAAAKGDGDVTGGTCASEEGSTPTGSSPTLVKCTAQPVLGSRMRPQSAPSRPSPRHKQQSGQQQSQSQQSRTAVKAPKSRSPDAHPPKRPTGPTVYERSLGRRVEVSELRKMEKERFVKFAQRFHFEGLVDLEEEERYSDDEDQVKENEGALVPPAKKSPPKRSQSSRVASPPHSTESSTVSGRNAKSVDTFVQKMRNLREGGSLSPGARPSLKHFDTPRQLPCYAHLRPLDMVISVEHCVNCDSHKGTVRHNSTEYLQRARDVLRQLVSVVHAYGPCCRVGVVCEAADVESTGDHFRCNGVDNGHCAGCGSESRLGAFEVQVAVKQLADKHGESLLFSEVIHSKLGTRMWPNKKALTKRLESFLTSAGIKSYKKISIDERKGYIGDAEMASYQPGSTYPVGVIDWTDVALCHDTWAYIRSTSGVSRVCWAFDSSPLFWVGETVVVKDTPLPLLQSYALGAEGAAPPEKYSFLANVVWVQSDELLLIRPQYFDIDVPCLAANCSMYVAHDEQQQSSSRAPYEYVTSRSRLPLPLHVVLNFAVDEKLCNWTVLSSSDKHIKPEADSSSSDYLLCRDSFYRQIRELVWRAMVCRPGTAAGAITDYSSPDYCEVDAQLAYADIVLDWVFREAEDAAAKSGAGDEAGQVSMSQLVKWARSGQEYFHSVIGQAVSEALDSSLSGATGHSSFQVTRVSLGGPIATAVEEKHVNIVAYLETSDAGSPLLPHSITLDICGVKYMCGKCVVRKPPQQGVNLAGNTSYFDCIFSVRGMDPGDVLRNGKISLDMRVSKPSDDDSHSSDEERSVHIQLMA